MLIQFKSIADRGMMASVQGVPSTGVKDELPARRDPTPGKKQGGSATSPPSPTRPVVPFYT